MRWGGRPRPLTGPLADPIGRFTGRLGATRGRAQVRGPAPHYGTAEGASAQYGAASPAPSSFSKTMFKSSQIDPSLM